MTSLPILQKPSYGAPCNGCGFCCQNEVCTIGTGVFGKINAPCPALTFREGRYWCGLVEAARTTEHQAFLVWRLGIGVGCDSEAA